MPADVDLRGQHHIVTLFPSFFYWRPREWYSGRILITTRYLNHTSVIVPSWSTKSIVGCQNASCVEEPFINVRNWKSLPIFLWLSMSSPKRLSLVTFGMVQEVAVLEQLSPVAGQYMVFVWQRCTTGWVLKWQVQPNCILPYQICYRKSSEPLFSNFLRVLWLRIGIC